MRHLLLSSILLFSLSACNDDSKKVLEDTKIIQKAHAEKEALLTELKVKEKALQEARQEAQIAKEKLLLAEKEKRDAFIASQKEKEKIQKQAKQNEKLSKVGINIQDDTITIDTNKTKDFFEEMGKNMGEKFQKMTQDFEKGILKDKEAGVDIDDKHINIDLNKTKDFLEAWSKKIQELAKEFDTIEKN